MSVLLGMLLGSPIGLLPLALPELGEVIRIVVLLLFFALPALKAILRSLGVTKDGVEVKAKQAAKRERALARRAVSNRPSLDEVLGVERPPEPQPKAIPAPAPAPPPKPRAAPLRVDSPPLPPSLREMRPSSDALGAIPTEQELEAGADIFRGGLAGSHTDEVLVLPGGKRVRRLAPNGWRQAMILREVLGPPRAFEELDTR